MSADNKALIDAEAASYIIRETDYFQLVFNLHLNLQIVFVMTLAYTKLDVLYSSADFKTCVKTNVTRGYHTSTK